MKLLNSKAFTLIEVVVAATLTAILLVALLTIFTAGIGVFKNFGNGLYPFNEARIIFQKMETDFLSLIAGDGLFRGNSSPVTMDFISKDSTEGTIFAVRYQYNSAQQLLQRLTEDTASSTLPGNISSNQEIIGENVTSLTFTFYGGTPDGLQLDASDSGNNWSDTTNPAAVKVDIQIQDNEDPTIIESFSRILAIRNRVVSP